MAKSTTEPKPAADAKAPAVSLEDLKALRAELAELKDAQAAAVAEAAASKPGKPRAEKMVAVETNSPTYRRPGSTIKRWGYVFTVGESGTDQVGEVPESDVMNGVRAGRWKPLGMSDEEAGEEYIRGLYFQLLGKPPHRNATPSQMKGEMSRFRMEQAERAGVGSLGKNDGLALRT